MANSLRSEIQPFHGIDIMTKAKSLERSGIPVMHLALGEPGAKTPHKIRQAAVDFIKSGKIGYEPALGILELRKRISQHYFVKYGLDVSPQRVVVTTGASAAFKFAALALFDVGDRVGLPTPCFPAYINCLKALGLQPVEIPTTEASRWIVTPEILSKAHAVQPLKGIVITSPNNPNGVITPHEISI